MKIARLLPRKKSANGGKTVRPTYGFVDTSNNNDNGDYPVLIRDELMYATGVPLPRGIDSFLFEGWYDDVQNTDVPYAGSIGEYDVLAPLPNPGKIVCLAFNYVDHAKEQETQAPEDPVLFIKPRTALTGTGSEIRCPNFVKQLDYEVELAVVIGSACKNVSPQDAYDHVFGYMILNDISARDIQFKDGQFTRGKSFDGFAPCGPWLTTADEIPDPQNLRLVTRINGETRQDSSTSMMLLKIPQIISKLSTVMTLEPGDVISTGTPAGVALKNSGVPYLKDGDIMEMEIEGLGSIRNTVRKV